MISQKELEKEYNKLLNNVQTKDFYTKIDLRNRTNCYFCDSCGHFTKTIDIDAGVTPMFFSCEKCGQRARSMGYSNIAPSQEATYEWFRPTLNSLMAKRKDEAFIDHILSGGLDYRKII